MSKSTLDSILSSGFARMIASHSATVDGPFFSAAASRRAGVQKAYRRCALGMCSGIVVWLVAPVIEMTATSESLSPQGSDGG